MSDAQELTIYARLIAAQSEFAAISQNNRAAAGQARYKYADISDVLSVIRPILNRHGLAVIQQTEASDETVSIETVLYDVKGEEIRSGKFVVSTKGLMQKGVQAYGSAVTYARRYSLVSFLGAAYGEQDDDGVSAVEAQKGKKPEVFKLTQEHIDEAKTVAAQGPESYKTYFMGLSNEHKRALVSSGWHDSCKGICKATQEG